MERMCHRIKLLATSMKHPYKAIADNLIQEERVKSILNRYPELKSIATPISSVQPHNQMVYHRGILRACSHIPIDSRLRSLLCGYFRTTEELPSKRTTQWVAKKIPDRVESWGQIVLDQGRDRCDAFKARPSRLDDDQARDATFVVVSLHS